MKNNARKIVIIILVCAIVVTLTAMLCLIFLHGDKKNESTDDGDRKIVRINDVDDVLINPGKGWVDYYGDVYNESYKGVVNLGYIRYDWSYIEPKKGEYNWKVIDDYISAYAGFGKKVAFGVMCANMSSLDGYVTPKWVFDEGAKFTVAQGTSWKDGSTITHHIPDWHDEIFLRNVNAFVKALGERYNGNENIAFIDIRSYGNWGEQHIFEIIKDDNYEYVINNRLTPEELRDWYIKPYMQAFPDTILVNPWGEAIYNDVYKWAIENGVSIRRDGVIGVSDGSECAMAEGKLPTIFEYTYDYSAMVDMGLWDRDKLLEYVKNGKPSYMRFYKEMYEENKEYCDYLANFMGYYFRIKQAEYDKKINLNSRTTINFKFKNDGVAPIFEKTYAYVALLDENDGLVAKFKTDINALDWTAGKEAEEEVKITVTGVEAGTYKLAFGLFQNEDDEAPAYLFGSEGKTEDKWYVFGNTEICD